MTDLPIVHARRHESTRALLRGAKSILASANLLAAECESPLGSAAYDKISSSINRAIEYLIEVNRTPEAFQRWADGKTEDDTLYVDSGLELVLHDGTAAGGMWMVFEITHCAFQETIGHHICCSVDSVEGGYECTYDASMEWDDGFISNTSDESLGYREDENDGTGTPMGGEIIDKLDGTFFFCPERIFRALMLNAK